LREITSFKRNEIMNCEKKDKINAGGRSLMDNKDNVI
jgi:hypothetical protein